MRPDNTLEPTYVQKFIDEAPADQMHIIWIDECGFNLHLCQKFGRSRAGSQASLTVANNRGRNISVCAAMSNEGFLHEVLRPGAYTAETFCAFLQELFLILHNMGRSNCWLIVDNVRFHHCAIVATCALQHRHMLVLLPPYSPMLNPIESLFSKWKTLIRSAGAMLTQDLLLEQMAAAHYEITCDDCHEWIREVD
jgi:transposase